MKRFLSCVAVVSLILALVAPALAHHGPHVARGFVAGPVVGRHALRDHHPRGHFGARHGVVFPAPGFVLGPVHYPAFTCWDFWVNGFWHFGTWVPAHWERVCR